MTAPRPPEDRLFAHVRQLQGDRPWGHVLDAGTGWSSLAWLCRLPSQQLTAVTASHERAEGLRKNFACCLRPQDEIVVGNWTDDGLLHGRVFEVVLADYLVGAADRFSPYFQGRLLDRLKPHLGQSLYLIGLEPYARATDSADSQLVTRISELRDATLLLAHDRPHREYPLWWMCEELQRRGYRVLHQKVFPIRYGRKFVEAELDVCRSQLGKLPASLARALSQAEKELREQALEHVARHGCLAWGQDYVIQACLA